MPNLTVKTALIGSFAVLTAAVAGVGAIAYGSLTSVQKNVAEMSEKWVPSIAVTRKLAADFSTARTREARHLMSENDEERRKVDSEVGQIHEMLRKDLSEYGALITSAEERANFDRMSELYQSYLKLESVFLDASNAANSVEASRLFRGDMLKLRRTLNEHIEIAVEMNRAGAEAAKAAAYAS